MYLEDLREYVLSKPGAEETLPFGPDTLVYKVNGKVFLLTGMNAHPLQFNVKCNPDKAIELREEYPQCVLPGYHMNKKHWNTIQMDGSIKDSLIKEWIKNSYNLVVNSLTRKEKTELEKLHDQHLTEKREMRKQEKRVKLANKRIAEYKKFKQIQTFK